MHCMKREGWLLAFLMTGLYVLGVTITFWPVLASDVVFVAPDAPIQPLCLREAFRVFFDLPSLQNLVLLFPYRWAYEGTFWVDGYVMLLAGVLLLRSRGVNWGAAWVGGLCAAFMGYFFTLFCAGHRGVVDALATSCLAFGLLSRGMQNLRWGWFAALGLTLALGLGAQADIWLLTCCALTAYGVWLLSAERGERPWRPWLGAVAARMALTATLFLLVGTPALRHTFGAAQETRTAQLTQATAHASTPEAARAAAWEFTTNWSLPPEDLLEWLLPDIHGRTSYPFDPKPYTGRMGTNDFALRQHSLFVGWLTLLLAGAAWAGRGLGRTPRERLFWLCLAGTTLLLALGRFTPCYRLIAWVPGLRSIRAPVKWLHLTGFALAILAGFGAERLLQKLPHPGTRRIGALALGLGITLCGAWVARGYVFPRNLAHNRLTAALPPGATLYDGLGWPQLRDICQWQGIPLCDRPEAADYVVAPVPQPGLKPITTLLERGWLLGLYRLPESLKRRNR